MGEKKINIRTYKPQYDKNFIVFDLYSPKQQNQTGILKIIESDKDNDKYIFGRSERADIKFTDISVSREHAFLFSKLGDWYVYDNNSKFGTLFWFKDFS